MITSLYSALMRPHAGVLRPVLGPPVQDAIGQVKQKATKMVRELKHVIYKEGLRELSIFSLEKREIQLFSTTKWGL